MPKSLEERVLGLIRGERLVRRGDRVLVSVSGGKDSAVAAWLLEKHAEELGIEVALLHMDQGIEKYSRAALDAVKALAQAIDVPLYVHRWEDEWGQPFYAVAEKLGRAPCSICGTLKRYYQNILAKRMGYNVVATGHNLDDAVGFIINNLITGQFEYIAKLSPVLPETELTVRKIKPLFWIQGQEIRTFAMGHNIPVSEEKCPFQRLAPTYKIRRAFDDVEAARPGTRRAFVRNVMRLVSSAQVREEKNKEPRACKYCGAPTSGEVCAVCKMKMRVGVEPGRIVLPERVM